MTATRLTQTAELTHDDLGPGLQLARLIDRATRADGHAPLGEHVLLTLDHPQPVEHARIAVRDGGELVGFCVLSQTGGAWYADLVTDPTKRSQGIGAGLAAAAADHVSSHGGGVLRAWGGTTGAPAALAQRMGMSVHRTLQFQRRELDHTEKPDELHLPVGHQLRSLRPDESLKWLALSNAAFDGHPENGGWTERDLSWRMAAPWTDLSRFIVATNRNEHLIAGVWTKLEPGSTDGELYVVAVHPDHVGQGLGRAVAAGALAALERAGALTATLYVDEANTVACRLYATLGFAVDHIDRCYTLDVRASSAR